MSDLIGRYVKTCVSSKQIHYLNQFCSTLSPAGLPLIVIHNFLYGGGGGGV